MQTLSIIVVLAVSVNAVAADTLSLNQKLIVACHRLDVRGVVAALRAGADPNAKFGRGDIKVFQDKWDLGWPVAGGDWTPLIALADSSPYPDPPREVKSTTEDWTWAHEQKARIPRAQIESRVRDQQTILLMLLSHKCGLDARDSKGGTALYGAIAAHNGEIAKVLIEYGANVNTRTGIYIDGPGDTTPLHVASWSKELTELLLKKGADPQARDSDGRTPLDWAKGRFSANDKRPTPPAR